MSEFLHRRSDFSGLLRIIAERDGITPTVDQLCQEKLLPKPIKIIVHAFFL